MGGSDMMGGWEVVVILVILDNGSYYRTRRNKECEKEG